MFDLAKDWPVFLFVGGMLYFFSYVIITGRREERKDNTDRHDR